MTIGIDIDDTMTNSSELIIEYAKKHFKSNDMNLINNILHGNNITTEMQYFYNKYLLELLSKYTLKKDVKEVIDRLRLQGHKVILISARGYGVKTGQITVTRNYLKRYKIKVDDIVFRTRDKSQACLDNKIDLMIDDSVEVLESLSTKGINTLLFRSISNKNIMTEIDYVDDWIELEAYIQNNLIAC